jgi:hypothetical protein
MKWAAQLFVMAAGLVAARVWRPKTREDRAAWRGELDALSNCLSERLAGHDAALAHLGRSEGELADRVSSLEAASGGHARRIEACETALEELRQGAAGLEERFASAVEDLGRRLDLHSDFIDTLNATATDFGSRLARTLEGLRAAAQASNPDGKRCVTPLIGDETMAGRLRRVEWRAASEA